MFDFNKIDSFKDVMDAGFILEYPGEVKINGIYVEFSLYKNRIEQYCIYGISHDTYAVNLEEKDWETFKKKVADYFLGVEDK